MSKAKRNPLPHPIVMLQWVDHTSKDSWIEEANVEAEVKAVGVVSVGWQILENDKAYYIAGGWNDDKEYTSVQTILKSACTKRVVLVK